MRAALLGPLAEGADPREDQEGIDLDRVAAFLALGGREELDLLGVEGLHDALELHGGELGAPMLTAHLELDRDHLPSPVLEVADCVREDALDYLPEEEILTRLALGTRAHRIVSLVSNQTPLRSC